MVSGVWSRWSYRIQSGKRMPKTDGILYPLYNTGVVVWICLHSPRPLNIGYPVHDPVWGGIRGMALLAEMCQWGVIFGGLKLPTTPPVCSGAICGLRCELKDFHFSRHTWLLLHFSAMAMDSYISGIERPQMNTCFYKLTQSRCFITA